VLRTGECAEIAGNTKCFAGIGIHVKPRRSAVTLCNLGPLERILLGINLPWILITKCHDQASKQVQQEKTIQNLLNPAHELTPTSG
jgi:hypothetical protein